MINATNFIGNLPKFSGEEKYWIISSGKQKDLYDYFYEHKIIGLAWDKINVNEINKKSLEDIVEVYKDKYQYLEKNYKEKSGYLRAVTIFSKELYYFVNEMQIGDIVVVKDRSRNKLMFGKVVSDAITAEEHIKHLPIDTIRGNCNKIRRIEWLRIKEKEVVSERIKNNIRTQQAIVKVNDDRTVNEINKTIFSLFVRGDYVHAVFNLKKEEDIEFENYYKFLGLIHEAKKDTISSETFYIKSNVSSPGPVEIFGKSIDVYSLLTSLGIITTGVASLRNKYLDTKEKLDIADPGEDEGFDIGN